MSLVYANKLANNALSKKLNEIGLQCFFKDMMKNWLMTNLIQIKHDYCNFEFITRVCKSLEQVPTYPIKWTMNISKYIEAYNVHKNYIKLPNDIWTINISKYIEQRL